MNLKELSQKERLGLAIKAAGWPMRAVVDHEAMVERNGERYIFTGNDGDLWRLAEACGLSIDFEDREVFKWDAHSKSHTAFYSWPADGTKHDCVIMAAAAIQLWRERQV